MSDSRSIHAQEAFKAFDPSEAGKHIPVSAPTSSSSIKSVKTFVDKDSCCKSIFSFRRKTMRNQTVNATEQENDKLIYRHVNKLKSAASFSAPAKSMIQQFVASVVRFFVN
jgi:hypothetical protein